MAGDWIKVENITPDKPEIHQMAVILELDADAVFGKSMRIWIWADEQSEDGRPFVTLSSRSQRDKIAARNTLDRVAYCPGFADALETVGWLMDTDDGLVFPNFERHNGQTAKTRGLAAKRQKRKRESSHDSVTLSSRSQRDKIVTREEKRREENNGSGTNVPEQLVGPVFPCSGRVGKDGTRPSYQAPQSLVDQMIEAYPCVDVMGQLKEAALWCETNAAKRKTREGMPRFLNSWMARQQDRGNRSTNGRATTPIGEFRNPFKDLDDDEST